MAQEVQSDDGLRAFLAERDVPCPGCGYNLRGMVSEPICPECGIPFELAVVRSDASPPAPRRWRAGQLPLLITMVLALPTVPFGIVFGVFAMLDHKWRFAAALLGLAIAYVWGFTLERRWRKGCARFVKKSEAQQRLLVAGCWVVTGALGYLLLAVLGALAPES